MPRRLVLPLVAVLVLLGSWIVMAEEPSSAAAVADTPSDGCAAAQQLPLELGPNQSRDLPPLPDTSPQPLFTSECCTDQQIIDCSRTCARTLGPEWYCETGCHNGECTWECQLAQ